VRAADWASSKSAIGTACSLRKQVLPSCATLGKKLAPSAISSPSDATPSSSASLVISHLVAPGGLESSGLVGAQPGGQSIEPLVSTTSCTTGGKA
jgi:hypothetical protein